MDDAVKTREQLLADLEALRLQITQLSDAESKRRHAEEAVRESETRSMEMANSMPETIFELDSTGRLTFVNRVAFDKFGYTEEDFARGLNVSSMAAPLERERVSEDMRRVLQLGETRAEQYLAMRRDGTTFPCVVSTNRIMSNGQPVGLRGFVVDITCHRRAEEQGERLLQEVRRRAAELDATFASMPDGVVIYDPGGGK